MQVQMSIRIHNEGLNKNKSHVAAGAPALYSFPS
jgi:hypothetical protein